MPPKGTQITPAFYDRDLGEYMTLVGQCIKNAAGLWVPVSPTDPMPVNVGSSALPVQLSGSSLSVDPETGVKTVTSTAAEVFAGLAALDGRDKLIVYNEGSNNVYWGKGTVTPQNGFLLLPGDSIVFSLDSGQSIPIYFVAESDTVVRVGEMA